MEITMISAVMVMVAYFLLLCGAVGFVQDKRFFRFCAQRKSGGDPG